MELMQTQSQDQQEILERRIERLLTRISNLNDKIITAGNYVADSRQPVVIDRYVNKFLSLHVKKKEAIEEFTSVRAELRRLANAA